VLLQLFEMLQVREMRFHYSNGLMQSRRHGGELLGAWPPQTKLKVPQSET